jgi:hypothetical protein
MSTELPTLRFNEPLEKSAGLARQLRRVREFNGLAEGDTIKLEHSWEADQDEVDPMERPYTRYSGSPRGSYEGKGRFWVHYPELKDDTHYFLENLLGGRPPQWEYIEDDAPSKERDVV